MNIRCDKCTKIFEVKESLIPSKGRLVKCGSCYYEWFFKPNIHELESNLDNDFIDKIQLEEENDESINIEPQDKNVVSNKEVELSKSQLSSKNLSRFLKLIIVAVISFFALLILLDTFKGFLSNYFPDLENILQNFYETLKDISLFFKDLIN